jgi:hypothetical protein
MTILASLLISACAKEEPLWVLPPAGSETSADFELGENYEHVVYFNLNDGMQHKRKLRDWDIAFGSGIGTRNLMLNGGNEVQSFNTHDSCMDTHVPLPKEGDWQWDNPNGHLDSTAIGCWWQKNSNKSKGDVYILDRGPKAMPRFLRMKILGCDTNQFTVLFADMNGFGQIIKSIKRNYQSNYTYFDLGSLRTVDFEPPSNQWDIVFTKYRYIYYHMTPITPYYVCGALINTKNCRVYESRNLSFEEINKETAISLVLSKKADEIGYDWKYFDLNSLRYSITKNQVFVIEDKEGYLYKLKFIDFYNSSGQKGHPSFVYQRL